MHLENRASLHRRANEPQRKYTPAERNAKEQFAVFQLLGALDRDLTLMDRIAEHLGVSVSPFAVSTKVADVLDLALFAQQRHELAEAPPDNAKFNEALKGVGYTGELLPEEHQRKDPSPKRPPSTHTREQEKEFERKTAELEAQITCDKRVPPKFREALGLDVSTAVKGLG